MLILSCAVIYYRQIEKEKSQKEERILFYTLIISLLFQIPKSFQIIRDELQGDFSGAKETANFIIKNKLDTSILIGNQAWAASAISPYLNKDIKFYYPENDKVGTFYIYDSTYLNGRWAMPSEYCIKPVLDKYNNKIKSCVFVLNRPFPAEYGRDWKLLFQNTNNTIMKDEYYYLYKIRDEVEI
jgi:hypothetical protein